jgi:hypothetical protein
MKLWFLHPKIWLWFVPTVIGTASIISIRRGFATWQEAATLALTAIAAFFAWIGARNQIARPRLLMRLSVIQRLGGRIVELHVCDGEAVIQPILENSGDLVAERSFVQLSFPTELEPTVRAERYQPLGGMIREVTPDLQLDGDNPGVLHGWVKTTIFPGKGLYLDRIHLKPAPGEHQVQYTVAFDHGTQSGHAIMKFMYSTLPK